MTNRVGGKNTHRKPKTTEIPSATDNHVESGKGERGGWRGAGLNVEAGEELGEAVEHHAAVLLDRRVVGARGAEGPDSE